MDLSRLRELSNYYIADKKTIRHFLAYLFSPGKHCKRRSNNPSQKRPICTVAPEQNCGS